MQSALRGIAILILALVAAPFLAADNKPAEQKYTAILIWGTDDGKPDDKDLKDLDEALLEKFRKLPVKWKNFYEVTRKDLVVKTGHEQKITLSDKCELKIHQTEKEGMAVELIGDKKTVYKGTRSMPTKEMLIFGGDDKNATAWFVVLKPE
jgi:hypothetical protein